MAIRRCLIAQPDYVALCHWNMHLDNAWFWRDGQHELQTGLLDWGGVAQMNIGQAFFGMACGAEIDFLNRHRQELLELLVHQYHYSGGPAIEVGHLGFMMKLAAAISGVAWLLDAPAIIQAEVPDFATAADRYDPRLRDNFLARAQLHLLTVFLNEWKVGDIGGALRRFVIDDAP
jgi:hypothetical protein